MLLNTGIHFDRHDVLGVGGFGSVFRGQYKGKSVAVKRIEKRIDSVQPRELKIHLQLGAHPNIVKFFHFASDEDFRYIAMELCDASLDRVYLNEHDSRKYRGPALPNDFEVFYQLASGLKYIHSQKLIHRNIKPQSILISVKHNDQGEEVTIKWASFGLSRTVNERGTYRMRTIKGCVLWFSPEVMELMGRDLRIEETEGSVKSDVYAEGLVFGYILLKGRHLYGDGFLEIERNMKNNNPVNMSKIHEKHLARNLIEQMLTKSPDMRIASEEVVIKLQAIKNELTEKEKQLHQLCEKSSENDFMESIESLMQLGIDGNTRNKKGWNALHLLCFYNSSHHLTAAIKLLIKSGIDKDAKEKDGWNALHLLCFNNSSPGLIEAINLLINPDNDINATTNGGSNALHLLCYNNSSRNLINAIKLLIEIGIDINARKNDGCNALHLLCYNNLSPGLIDAIKLLIDQGIDKNAKNGNGWNALHILSFYNSSPHKIDAIKYFIELGIDVIV